eukprot:1195516-Prorocentrum_minimum.AAC.1
MGFANGVCAGAPLNFGAYLAAAVCVPSAGDALRWELSPVRNVHLTPSDLDHRHAGNAPPTPKVAQVNVRNVRKSLPKSETSSNSQASDPQANLTGNPATSSANADAVPQGEDAPEGDGTPAGKGVTEGDGALEGKGLPEGDGTPAGKGVTEADGTPAGKGVAEGDSAPAGKGVTEADGNPAGKGVIEGDSAPAGKGVAEVDGSKE